MTASSWRALRVVALIALLAAAPLGCGGGGLEPAAPQAEMPPGGVQGLAIGVVPAGQRTWAEMVEIDATLPPDEEMPPEGGDGEQLAPLPLAGPAALHLPSAPGPQPLVVDTPGFASITGFTGPPDTMGAAGPNHLMTTLNQRVQVQTKDGAVVQGPVSLEAFFSALPNNMFDPRVVYSRIHGRWFVVANFDARLTTSGIGFAVSDTNDPTGNWTFYAFDIPGTANWTDFVSIGVNKNWIAITTDVIVTASGAFVGEEMWVVTAASALAGGALTVTQFNAPFDAGTPTSAGGRRIKPAVTHDPLEETLYCASSVYNPGAGGADGTQYLRLSRITQGPGGPVWSPVPDLLGPFPGSGLFQAPINYSGSGGLFQPAPQAGGGTNIDTGRALLSSEPQFRNGRLWLCHTGGLPAGGAENRTAIFWYELDPSLLLLGNPVIQNGVCDGAGGGGGGEQIQQLLTDGSISGAGNHGQSFTVSISGTITNVGFRLNAAAAGNIQIYAGAGNGGALLSSDAYNAAGGALEVFALAGTPVTPGVYTWYATGTVGVSAQQRSGNVYTGGIAYNGAGSVANTDMVFQVDIAGAAQNDWYYYPSLAVNAQGDMCLGFSRSSSSLFVEAVVTGRDDTDPLGTLDPLIVLKQGEANYVNLDNNGRNRWGDYSATCVDPVDDLTIWTIQEYAETGNVWGTWWGRHAVFAPLTMTSTLTYPVTALGATSTTPLDCGDPPDPDGVDAECTSTDGAELSVDFDASAPSGAAFDVELRIDGAVVATQTAAQMVPGPSALAGSFDFTLSPGGPYLVEVRATDGAGDIEICQVEVLVEDTTAPALTPCPADITAECTSPAGAVVTFPAPTATDICDGPVAVTCDPPSGSVFPLGTTQVTCSAVDLAGNDVSCSFQVTVEDTTPPVVTLALNRSLIWSPRSGLIDVLFDAVATDICDPDPQLSLAVHADEGDGGDVAFTPGIDAVRLRAERDDASQGRIYLVVVRGTDAAGNADERCLAVVVPGQFTTGAINALFAAGSAGASACEGASGAAPGGFLTLLGFTDFP